VDNNCRKNEHLQICGHRHDDKRWKKNNTEVLLSSVAFRDRNF